MEARPIVRVIIPMERRQASRQNPGFLKSTTFSLRNANRDYGGPYSLKLRTLRISV